jgi:NAD(P)H-dependent FMN reductase
MSTLKEAGETLKGIILVGSLRQSSYNRMLAETMRERYRARMNLDIADLQAIPMYNQDEEQDPPAAVRDLKGKIREADAVLIITPEYNWSVPGVLKNALDWISRVDKVLAGKPVMTAGVSTGQMGTIRAQLHLRDILASMRARLLPPSGNEILIGSAAGKFDEASRRITDEAALQFIDGVFERFLAFIRA